MDNTEVFRVMVDALGLGDEEAAVFTVQVVVRRCEDLRLRDLRGHLRSCRRTQNKPGSIFGSRSRDPRTSGAALPGFFQVTRALADHALQADGTQRQLQSWGHTPVQALAGIAKPEVFFAMLRAKGLTLAHTQALPDHADLQDLQIDDTLASKDGDVLCTEKDAVKLWAIAPQAWAVPLETTLPADLLAAVDQHLTAAQRAKLSSPHGHQTA